MRPEKRSPTLGLFAGLEGVTGLGPLLVPGVVLGLLFGPIEPAPAALLLARLGGAGLLALGAASWAARAFRRSPAGLGLLVVVTLYNGLAAGVLAYAAIGLDRRGVLIWPALFCHAALLAWCLASARRVPVRR